MKRPHLLLAILLFPAGCATYPSAPPERLAPTEVRVAPFVAALGRTAAAITWETDARMYGWLEFRGPSGTGVVRTSSASTLHTVILSNLTPGAVYSYAVCGSGETGRAFRTFSPARERFSFGVIGDNRSDPKVFRRLTQKMAALPLDFVIHTGDTAGDGTKREHWYNEWFGPAEELQARMPMLVAWGSHEVPQNTNSWLHYFYQMRSPLYGCAYYTFEQGPLRFIVLNTEDDFGLGSPQYLWLESVLQSNQAPYTVVVFHVAVLSGSSHAADAHTQEVRRNLAPLLIRHGVALVLNGHDHTYSRSEYGGVVFVIAGGAGAPLYPARQFLNPFVVCGTTCYSYLVVDATPAMLHATAYTLDGTVIDAFSLTNRPRRTALLDGVATFRPPWRDYLDREIVDGAIYLRNFTTGALAGTITITAPSGWPVDPGTNQTFFLNRDEPLRETQYRLLAGTPATGMYPLRVTVAWRDATNTLSTQIECLPSTPARIAWTFDSLGQSLAWSNARNASVSAGMWTAQVYSNAVPELYAPVKLAGGARGGNYSTYRMRLSGSNGVTKTTIAWTCVTDEHKTNVVSRSEPAQINGQWYTYLFFAGRELSWNGTPIGIQLVPAADPNVTVELDDVRLCSSPEQAP